MKKIDFYYIAFVIILFAPFFLSEQVYNYYNQFNTAHGMWMSFLKFSILATAGEMLGLRIKTGHYSQPGFGGLARAVVWGFIGLTIKLSFIIFGTGTPAFLAYMGMTDAPTILAGSFTASKLLVAFCISTSMNLIYGPVMMTIHKITDLHIIMNNGNLSCLLRPIQVGNIMERINWRFQWDFVFKKTIPFFWIPAHTITFLLPVQFQVLFAALLGIALGVILALASHNGSRQK
ncbi:MAG TPA: hypothetical protein DCR43_00970 [Bacteroidales bacterium]|nr:MAG: hypothetical protein A2X11_14795 [Bacteroidetes bacterium GWE2_42_24]OFY31617.1 MAG: hypothetical protein A2X09_08535 [Bacteroidetes bacterium GWF2_43_11]HAQ64424.1 hypothetical protein [Bacteroidales bacterium]HBZ67126.1 hypothetical protein [Bacteroidales bacterium]